MSNEINCPKCFKTGFWKTADKRLRCKNCHHIFTLKTNPFNVSNQTLKEVISEFLLEHSTNVILERIEISKYKLLKILTTLRALMASDIPNNFHGLIKKDFLDLKENSNYKTKHPVIGILCKDKKIYSRILPNIEKEDLEFLIKKNKEIELSEDWQRNVGLLFRGSLFRLSPPENKNSQIDTMTSFWGYLKRKLSAKGGIRKEKLPLYLGEYTWRYNNQKLTLKEQEERLMNLIHQRFNLGNN